MSYRVLVLALGLTACTENIKQQVDGASQKERNSSSAEVMLSGNGSGYNGKISYQQTNSGGSCPGEESNVLTQVDVEVVSGVAMRADLVRTDCQAVKAQPLTIGREITIEEDLSSAIYQGATLMPAGSPSAACSGISNNGREVTIVTTAHTAGGYDISVTVNGNIDAPYYAGNTQLTGQYSDPYIVGKPSMGKFWLTPSNGQFEFELMMESPVYGSILMSESGICQ
ncbi:MAG: hypothetical protein AB7F86_11990 [Bdellovibrionales bacterium]